MRLVFQWQPFQPWLRAISLQASYLLRQWQAARRTWLVILFSKSFPYCSYGTSDVGHNNIPDDLSTQPLQTFSFDPPPPQKQNLTNLKNRPSTISPSSLSNTSLSSHPRRSNVLPYLLKPNPSKPHHYSFHSSVSTAANSRMHQTICSNTNNDIKNSTTTARTSSISNFPETRCTTSLTRSHALATTFASAAAPRKTNDAGNIKKVEVLSAFGLFLTVSGSLLLMWASQLASCPMLRTGHGIVGRAGVCMGA